MFFYDGFWYTYIVQLGVMSVNRLNLLSFIIHFNGSPFRLISITFPMSFKHIFSKSRTLTIIGCDFLAGFLIALPVLFPCCRMPYYFEYLAVIYEDPLTWLVSIFFRAHSYHLNIKENSRNLIVRYLPISR